MRPKLTHPETGTISASYGSKPIVYDEKEDQLQALLDAIAEMLADMLAGMMEDEGFEQRVTQIINNYFYNYFTIIGGPDGQPPIAGDGLYHGATQYVLHVGQGPGILINPDTVAVNIPSPAHGVVCDGEGYLGAYEDEDRGIDVDNSSGKIYAKIDIEKGLEFDGSGAIIINAGEGLNFETDGEGGEYDLNLDIGTVFSQDDNDGDPGPGLVIVGNQVVVAPEHFLYVTT